MRILFLTQYYPPETGAPQNRLSDLARRLKNRGHQVTILTAMPNYPRGQVFEDYRGRLRITEEIDGIRVIRTWIYVKETSGFSFIRRMASYLSFAASSLILGFTRTGPIDVVLVESPPLFLGISGWLISRLRRAALVMNISDLWPKSAVEMGLLHNQRMIKLATRLEEFLYRRSALISGQARGIIDDIAARFPRVPVVVVTNGVAMEAYREPPDGSQLRQQIGLNGDFVVGYAGLHGIAQGLDLLIDTARLISGKGHTEVRFVFIGDGPEKPKLLRRAEAAGLQNVIFRPPMEHREMPEAYAAFDIAVVPLKKLDLFKGVLPSKLFEAMAAGRPVIVSIDGEVRKIVQDANGGVYVEPERPDLMAQAIMDLHDDPSRRHLLARNARTYVMENFDREKIADRFERALVAALAN